MKTRLNQTYRTKINKILENFITDIPTQLELCYTFKTFQSEMKKYINDIYPQDEMKILHKYGFASNEHIGFQNKNQVVADFSGDIGFYVPLGQYNQGKRFAIENLPIQIRTISTKLMESINNYDRTISKRRREYVNLIEGMRYYEDVIDFFPFLKKFTVQILGEDKCKISEELVRRVLDYEKVAV